MAVKPTHEASKDHLEERVMSIVLADIKARGAIFRAIVKQLDAEAMRCGLKLLQPNAAK